MHHPQTKNTKRPITQSYKLRLCTGPLGLVRHWDGELFNCSWLSTLLLKRVGTLTGWAVATPAYPAALVATILGFPKPNAPPPFSFCKVLGVWHTNWGSVDNFGNMLLGRECRRVSSRLHVRFWFSGVFVCICLQFCGLCLCQLVQLQVLKTKKVLWTGKCGDTV